MLNKYRLIKRAIAAITKELIQLHKRELQKKPHMKAINCDTLTDDDK